MKDYRITLVLFLCLNFISLHAMASPAARAVALQTTLKYLHFKKNIDPQIYNHVKDEVCKVGLDASKNYSSPIYALTKANKLAWNGIKNEDNLSHLKIFSRTYEIAFNCLHIGYINELKILDKAFENYYQKKS